MKNVSATLDTLINSSVTTLRSCWKITRLDGVILGFTDHIADIEIGGIVFKAETGFTASNIDNTLETNPSNIELTSYLDDNAISEIDLASGVYDGAKIYIFQVDYTNVPNDLNQSPPKHLSLLKGFLGRVKQTDKTYTVEVESLAKLLETKTGYNTSNYCRYQFGDSRCGVNLSSHTYSLAVTQSLTSYSFNTTSYPDNTFTGSYLIWTSGNNNGIKMLISSQIGSTLILAKPCVIPIQVGDQFQIVAACNKTWEACGNYGNTLNFGGEYSIPGTDAYISTRKG